MFSSPNSVKFELGDENIFDLQHFSIVECCASRLITLWEIILDTKLNTKEGQARRVLQRRSGFQSLSIT